MYHKFDKSSKNLSSDGESENESSSSDDTEEEGRTTDEFETNRVINLIRHNALIDRLSNLREGETDSENESRPQNYDSDDTMTDVSSLEDDSLSNQSDDLDKHDDQPAQSTGIEDRAESESDSNE